MYLLLCNGNNLITCRKKEKKKIVQKFTYIIDDLRVSQLDSIIVPTSYIKFVKTPGDHTLHLVKHK